MTRFIDFGRDMGLLMPERPKKGALSCCANGSYFLAASGHYGWVKDSNESIVFWTDGQTGTEQERKHDMKHIAVEQFAAHAVAARRAKTILARCVIGTHPYLAAKGFPEAFGLIDTDHRLVLPLYIDGNGELSSLQWVTDDGSKKFLPGGKVRGCAHPLGARYSGVPWLVEGAATGMAVIEALKLLHRPGRVICCMFASNLATVAKHVGGYVFADHDFKNEHTGKRPGEQAAINSGQRWCQSPTEGYDANDEMTHNGIEAVAALMRPVMA